jgi:glycosyltransferase involved in cell wall biosynthesis
MPDATIVITTKNRRDELREMLPSALAQTADAEVLVIDDGSTDGTSEMVREDFPEVRLDRTETSLGLIVQRSRAASLAIAPVIVSIDDDARFPSATTVAQTLIDFDHPRIGAVAIPFVDVRSTTVVRQQAPDGERRWVTSSYIGTAHAVRRDIFVALGGYRGQLRQMTEEPDFCLRLLDAGYVTRLGRADHIHHFESPKRDFEKLVYLGRRGDVLHGWHNVPTRYLPVRWTKVVLHSAVLARQFHETGAALRGLRDGFRDAVRYRDLRDPVRPATYRIDHELRLRGPLRLEEIEGRLPPVTQPSVAAPRR